LKPRLKFILKIYFLLNSKPNGQKLGFDILLTFFPISLTPSGAE